MARPCTTCRHAERDAIERQLLERVSLKEISATYKLGMSSLSRHRQVHLQDSIQRAHETAERIRELSLLDVVAANATAAPGERIAPTTVPKLVTRPDGSDALRWFAWSLKRACRDERFRKALADAFESPELDVDASEPHFWLLAVEAILRTALAHPDTGGGEDFILRLADQFHRDGEHVLGDIFEGALKRTEGART